MVGLLKGRESQYFLWPGPQLTVEFFSGASSNPIQNIPETNSLSQDMDANSQCLSFYKPLACSSLLDNYVLIIFFAGNLG